MRNKHLHYQDLCKDMRYFIAIFAFFVFFVPCIFGETSVGTQSIAVIDLKKVAAESQAGKGIEIQVANKNNQSKKDLVDLEDKIKSMEANKLSGSDPRKVEELQLILYDMVKERRFQISEAYRKAISALETIIQESIKEIVDERKIDVVLAADAVVFSEKNCADITNETIKRVDMKCKYIELIVKGEAKND